MTTRNFEPEYEVTYYRARCTNCGTVETEYGDFSAMSDVHDCIETLQSCAENAWFARYSYEPSPTPDCPQRKIVHIEELLCPECQSCEVVCADHEGHDFDAVPVVTAVPRGDLP